MSFISTIQIETEDQDDDFAEVLTEERRKLCAELKGFRVELIEGFAYPARKHRCNFICRRLNEIDAQLAELDE